MIANNRIVWIDVETTGVNAYSKATKPADALLEVACIVTDGDLNVLHEGYSTTIAYSDTDITKMKLATVPYVLDMHKKTDLWSRIRADHPDSKDRRTVDAELSAYIASLTPDGSPLGGNSITLDRNFLEANLPHAYARLGYRSVDVSTLAQILRQWDEGLSTYTKRAEHSALSDIRESIGELRYYRAHLGL